MYEHGEWIKTFLIFFICQTFEFWKSLKDLGGAQDTPAGNLFEVVSRPKRQTVE